MASGSSSLGYASTLSPGWHPTLPNDSSSASSGNRTLSTSRTSAPGSSTNKRKVHRDKTSVRSSVRKVESEDVFNDIRQLFDILYTNEVPGPRLLRLHQEFNHHIGSGSEGFVHAPSSEYERLLSRCDQHANPTIRYSARQWKFLAIKQLRYDRNDLEPATRLKYEVRSALSEVSKLCHQKLRSRQQARGIVKLEGWGLDLDSLEDRDSYLIPRLPLLILEKARSDLSVLLSEDAYADLSFRDIRLLALDIGIGLSAIHSAGIAHRDLKTQNILIFPPNSQQQSAESPRWSAKICDFGHAIDSNEPVSTKLSDGTQAWKPLEYYGPDVLVDARACDIFSYGLLVWAIFAQRPESPLINVPADELSDAWGHQKPWYDAVKDLDFCWSPRLEDLSPISEIESLSDEGIRAPSTSGNVRDNKFSKHLGSLLSRCLGFMNTYLSSLTGAIRYTRKTPGQIVVATVRNYGPDLNRILEVLAKALHDDPRERLTQPPPHYLLNLESVSYSSLTRGVEAPRRVRKRPSDFASPSLKRQFTPDKAVNSVPLRQISLSAASNTLFFYAKALLPFLRPSRSRQRTYEALHRVFSDLIGHELDDSNIVGGPLHTVSSHCLPLSASRQHQLSRFVQKSGISRLGMLNSKNPSDLLLDSLYAFARIRCRFQQCCWEKALDFDQGSSRHNSMYTSIETALTYVENNCCDEVAAWALRRKSAFSFQTNQIDPYFDFLFRHLRDPLQDNAKTFRLRLLLERRFFLGQELDRPHEKYGSMSIFAWYMCSIANENIVLLVAQHFRSEAESEHATDESKRYYYGHLDDSFEGVPDQNDGTNPDVQFPNTALHDAVLTGNYVVVDYFMRTGFNMTARDGRGRTPFDLAGEKYSEITSDLGTPVRERKQILDLLSRHPSSQSRRDLLPLGWQKGSLKDGVPLFQETSVKTNIEPSYDPLTFKEPRVGLLQDERIAIAKRDVKGSPQTYWLNPIRFLRKTEHVPFTVPGKSVWESDSITATAKQWRRPTFTGKSNEGPLSLLAKNNVPAPEAPQRDAPFNQNPFQQAIERMQFAAKVVFDDSWYQEEAVWVRTSRIDIVSEHRVSVRMLTAGLRSCWDALSKVPLLGFPSLTEEVIPSESTVSITLRSYISSTTSLANVLLVFVPLSIISRVLGWSSNQQIVYSVLGVSILVPNVIVHVEILLSKFANEPFRRPLACLTSLIPDAVIGITSILLGNTRFPLSLIVGNALSNNLLLLGLCIILGGLNRPQQFITSLITSTYTGLSTVTSVFLIIAYTFYNTGSVPVESGILVVTRGFAVVSLCIGSLSCLFRLTHSHDGPWDAEMPDQNRSTLFSPFSSLTFACIFAACLVMTSENLMQALQIREKTMQDTFALIIIPVACKFLQHMRTIVKALIQFQLDSVIDWTVGANVLLSLFVVPIWILFAWIVGQSFTLLLDLQELAIVGIASWIPAKVLENSRTKYLDGVALVVTYIVAILGLYLAR